MTEVFPLQNVRFKHNSQNILLELHLMSRTKKNLGLATPPPSGRVAISLICDFAAKCMKYPHLHTKSSIEFPLRVEYAGGGKCRKLFCYELNKICRSAQKTSPQSCPPLEWKSSIKKIFLLGIAWNSQTQTDKSCMELPPHGVGWGHFPKKSFGRNEIKYPDLNKKLYLQALPLMGVELGDRVKYKKLFW